MTTAKSGTRSGMAKTGQTSVATDHVHSKATEDLIETVLHRIEQLAGGCSCDTTDDPGGVE